MPISNEDMVRHIAETNVKLEYIQKGIETLSTTVPGLATKEDIAKEIFNHGASCPVKLSLEKIDERLSNSPWPKSVKDWVHTIVLAIAVLAAFGIAYAGPN